MALENSDYWSIIVAVPPAQQANANAICRGILGFNTGLYNVSRGDPFTPDRYGAHYSKVAQNDPHFDFLLKVHQDTLTLEDCPEGTLLADLTAFLAATTTRTHRIQQTVDEEGYADGTLVSDDGAGNPVQGWLERNPGEPRGDRKFWLAELADLGWAQTEPAPEPQTQWTLLKDTHVTIAERNRIGLLGKTAAEGAGATLTNGQALAFIEAVWNDQFPGWDE